MVVLLLSLKKTPIGVLQLDSLRLIDLIKLLVLDLLESESLPGCLDRPLIVLDEFLIGQMSLAEPLSSLGLFVQLGSKLSNITLVSLYASIDLINLSLVL